MRDKKQHPEPNPEPGHPQGETLPDESPTAGEAAMRKGDVEVDGPKGAKSGEANHGAEHGEPAI
jgi:hypothetical protein